MGFLGALLGAAPTVLGGIAKGKRDREQTEYTRDQASMRQAAEENARQQALAQAMQEFQARQEDTRANREMGNEYRKASLRQTKEIADQNEKARREIAADQAKAAMERAQLNAVLRREIAAGRQDGAGKFTIQQDKDGNFFRVNTKTGEYHPVTGADGQPVQGSGARPGAGERQNAGLASLADEAITDIRNVESRPGYSPPSGGALAADQLRRIPFVGDALANAAQSDDTEELLNNYTQLVLATQFAISGKAATEAEARRLARTLIPTAGESAQSQASKRANVDRRTAIFQQMSGRAATGKTAPGAAPAGPPVKRPSPRSALGITP